MKPHFVEIKDSETQESIFVDMEGPYHLKKKRIGEHVYGITIYIDNIPYHFEKYIPTEEVLLQGSGLYFYYFSFTILLTVV